ncbi:reticulon-4-interacting protein 1, mitochondrial-like [Sitodiplosis mosellana]|uniref:reticulon-4-interacting protein 1, mitochondrial-like n=1 Tax=Sitodiplosis mosellana TaxID=263140 RepID=UPI002444472B|nr:reticulon-4-interacting protein 1, mitochondrial-like [Sitodiplosis mosellana]
MDSKLMLVLVVAITCGHSQVLGDRLETSEISHKFESDQMSGWEINEYVGINALKFNDSIKLPKIKSRTEVLIEVIATSINPLDQLMTAGYGQRVLNTLRHLKKIKEFPLILGREFSGVVKAKGKSVRKNIQVGDKVFGIVPTHQPGSLAEYVIVDQKTIVRKPENIEDVGASGIMFAGLTAWSSLYLSGLAGGLRGALTSRGGGKGLSVCILGASGGVGTLAVQIAKAEQMNISATCSTDSVETVKKLGAGRVIDYRTENVSEAVRGQFYDIILDAAGLGADYATSLPWKFSQYITLQPPLLNDTDSGGIILGSVKSALTLIKNNVKTIHGKRGLLKWGFFIPAPQGIEYLRKLVENGQLKPIIDSTYDFNAAKEAFEKVAKGHLRGKVVVKVK